MIQMKDMRLEIKAIENGVFRVHMSSRKKFRTSLLERYGLITEPNNKEYSCLKANEDDNRVYLNSDEYSVFVDKSTMKLSISKNGEVFNAILPEIERDEEGFNLLININDTEKLYGLGDENRESLNKRGRTAELWVKNASCYGPIPFLMSSNGWGVFVNSTYRQKYDLGKNNPNIVKIEAEKGDLDFYIFLGNNLKEIIAKYAIISGKSIILPKAAYGLTYVMNQETNNREMLEDCRMFRKLDIPCDMVGLEPYWMDNYYDYSTEKKWSKERFFMPGWMKDGSSNMFTVFYNLRKMGYKLSLWLCCDYDLLWEEEKATFVEEGNNYEGAAFEDEHFNAAGRLDKITKPGEAWFEHLKKFVDNGAYAFKLDGANQVLEHPDRVWAGKYLDDEVHNVYPVILAKQMKEGFTEHTKGRRAMIYTDCIYTGTQKYAATWAGDTGGNPKTLTSILNLSLCGLSNTSFDMDHWDVDAIHFGFLAAWAQLCNWVGWQIPWYMGDDIEDAIRTYSNLRATLFPYIYSMAHIAANTSVPIVRPMCLEYSDDAFSDTRNMYMLGDSLLVGAFDMNLHLPEGEWYDIFTGDIHEGGKDFVYDVPKGYGGALFAKSGALWVTQQAKPFIDKDEECDYTINIFPGADNSFDLIEDDGVTYGYLNNEIAKTHMELKNADNSIEFTLFRREGGYTIDETVQYKIDYMSENHIANVKPLPDVTGFTVVVYSKTEPKQCLKNGSDADYKFNDGKIIIDIEKSEHIDTNVVINIEF